MAKTSALYQTVIDNVAALLTAVKAEAKTNKKLSNGVARLERLAKTVPVFAAKYDKVVAAAAKAAEEPAADKPAAKKTAKKAAKKKATAKGKGKAAEAAPAAKPAKKAAAKKKATPAPEPASEAEPPADATIQ